VPRAEPWVTFKTTLNKNKQKQKTNREPPIISENRAWLFDSITDTMNSIVVHLDSRYRCGTSPSPYILALFKVFFNPR